MIRSHVLVCGGAGCLSSGCHAVQDALKAELAKRSLDKEISLVVTGCMGPCDLGPVILVHPDGTFYQRVTALDVPKLVEEHFVKGRPYKKLLPKDEVSANVVTTQRDFGFFAKQQKIVLANCGIIDAEDIHEYIARDGYAALGKALTEMKPADVIAEIKESGLRGRGGAGFPTGIKWELLAKAPVTPKYLICNADEGDPGAFMNRAVLEGDPHAVLEGMCLAGYATGARRGFIYIRAEYPLAIKRLQIAIDQAYKNGLLGENIFEAGFDFDIEMRIGAGAFVCGEETALMRSIEGRRGQPQPRPPFPAQRGLWNKPTNINNVETWATVPTIIRKGAKWYSQFGTEKTKGTKVFALAGKVKNTGLAEVPYGTTLREIVFGIGGGVPGGKRFKAIQTGGPSGGVIPAEFLDTPVEYESLQKLGSIMGSGGMVVVDEETCMVDFARFFLEFCCDESCGKCPPCRVGTRQMLGLLEKIANGDGQMEDIDKLEQLAVVVKDASLCGLGQTAPNPVLTTLRYFRDEYVAHIRDGQCPAKVCRPLLSFTIKNDQCVGCSVCARNCPTNTILKVKGQKKYFIIEDDCIQCGACLDSCKFDAILKASDGPAHVAPPKPELEPVPGRKTVVTA
jgi:NADP-reducing hydrogenase subunit HndC